MSERAIKAYDYYKDLQQRAEYLLVGLLAASIAFFWQNSKPEPLGCNPATLHLVGLLFLIFALVYGIIRLDRQPFIFALNSDLLDLGEERASLVQSASQGKTVASGSYGVMNPDQQATRIKAIDIQMEVLKKKMREVDSLCTRLYRLRNIFMAFGYLIFVGHRIWLPYFTRNM
jgi:hypothetical protein